VLEQVKEDLRGKVIIDATVPLDPINLVQIQTESGKSAAEETLEMIPEAAVFAALQTISFRVLRQRDDSHDVLVAGGTQGKSGVMDLMRSMKLRPIDAGPLEVAGHIERLTALLLSINKANRVKESGISITGL
jgi:predicted dinucleotide-binding enzyme